MSEILRKLKESKEREEAELASKAAAKAAEKEETLQDDTSFIGIDDSFLFDGARIAEEQRLAEEERLAKSDKAEDRAKAEIMRKNDRDFHEHTGAFAHKPSPGKKIKKHPLPAWVTHDDLRGLLHVADPDVAGNKKLGKSATNTRFNQIMSTRKGVARFLRSITDILESSD